MMDNPESCSCEKTRDWMVEELNMGIDKKVAGYHMVVAEELKIAHKHKWGQWKSSLCKEGNNHCDKMIHNRVAHIFASFHKAKVNNINKTFTL